MTVLSWAQGDYKYFYLDEWMVVLGGHDPWLCGTPRNPTCNSYGPLFNALAPLVWVNPLANKLLFAFSYLAYVIWLIKDLAPRRGLVALSWPWLSLWILNPFPWVEIAYFGYFDVLVALACVAAVHSLISKRDGVSGTYLAVGILLKYMPIVILPFLVFSERRFHFRLLSFCVGVVIFGLVVSTLIWGTSTFLPLALAALRQPAWSIYDVLASAHSPLRLFWDPPNPNCLDWLEKPFLVTAGLGSIRVVCATTNRASTLRYARNLGHFAIPSDWSIQLSDGAFLANLVLDGFRVGAIERTFCPGGVIGWLLRCARNF